MKATKAFVILIAFVTSVSSIHKDRLKSLYPAYKLVEDVVKQDPTITFKLRETFFPAMNYRYWLVDGAEVIPFHICVIIQHKTEPAASTGSNVTSVTASNSVKNDCTAIWHFQWTNSLLLNLIPGDLLLAMDTVVAPALYSDIIESPHLRQVWLDFNLNRSSLPNMEIFEQAVVLFLSRVSWT